MEFQDIGIGKSEFAKKSQVTQSLRNEQNYTSYECIRK